MQVTIVHPDLIKTNCPPLLFFKHEKLLTSRVPVSWTRLIISSVNCPSFCCRALCFSRMSSRHRLLCSASYIQVHTCTNKHVDMYGDKKIFFYVSNQAIHNQNIIASDLGRNVIIYSLVSLSIQQTKKLIF